MPLNVNQINDAEVRRQKKNLTDSQKKKADATKEGVVVNELIKEPKNVDMNDLYNSMIISDSVQMPKKINENKEKRDRSIVPISIISAGVMATIALISTLVKRSTKTSLNIKPEKELENLTRNVSIQNEHVQGVYQMVHCPNKKTILAGTGVIALSAMAFIGKMFIDGFKEIWVKKQEADIQKNLQENLIAVETQSFSGKIQIIRSMLSEKAKEFSDYLCDVPKDSSKQPAFEGKNQKFGNAEQNKSSDNLQYFALGVATLGAIVGFGFLAIKNLSKGKGYLEKYIKEKSNEISNIVAKSNENTKQQDKEILKKMFQGLGSNTDYIKHELSKLNWQEKEKTDFIAEVIFNTEKSTTLTDRAIGGDGTPKPAFNSYVNGDYKAFFYNYLLDTNNPQFKLLFLGITGLSALSYGGKALGEGVKEVQVKKMNAQTELELQQQLVSTELRNFKAKKDAAIEPLCQEFYAQAESGKPKDELKTIAENILFEVKNGPPFVYS